MATDSAAYEVACPRQRSGDGREIGHFLLSSLTRGSCEASRGTS